LATVVFAYVMLFERLSSLIFTNIFRLVFKFVDCKNIDWLAISTFWVS